MKPEFENHFVIDFANEAEWEKVKEIIGDLKDVEWGYRYRTDSCAIYTTLNEDYYWTSGNYKSYLPKGWKTIKASEFIAAHEEVKMYKTHKEIYEALLAGKKITHDNWGSYEYVFLNSRGMLQDEDGENEYVSFDHKTPYKEYIEVVKEMTHEEIEKKLGYRFKLKGV